MAPFSIRPSLWAFALGILSVALFGVAVVTTHDFASDVATTGDPGRRGSVQEAYTGWQGERGGARGPRSVAGRSPEDRAWHFEEATAADLRPDPQVAAMQRTLGLQLGDAGMAAPFSPTHHAARLTQVSGRSEVREGQTCEVRILPVRTQSFNCLMRVMCGDVVLYPDAQQHAGYVPCELDAGVPVAARDRGTTHQDGDPTIELDTRSDWVRVSDGGDQAFFAELHLCRGGLGTC